MTRFFYIFLISFAVSLGSFKAFATNLQVADNLIIIEVDDKVIEHGFIGKQTTFDLSQGQHALVVKYKDVFEDFDLGQERVVESQEFVVKFSVSNQQKLTLSTTKIGNLPAAEKFSKLPKLLLVDENRRAQTVSLAKVSDYKLARQVNQAVSSIVESKKAPQQAVSVKPEITQTLTANQSQKIANNEALPVNSLVMLQYWWQTASPEQKRQFKAMIK